MVKVITPRTRLVGQCRHLIGFAVRWSEGERLMRLVAKGCVDCMAFGKLHDY